MTTIKVFRTSPSSELTENDIRQKYDYLKSRRTVDPAVLDDIMKLELERPMHIQLNNMMSIQIKNLLDWTISVFDGDPNISSQVVRNAGDIILDCDTETIGRDRTNKEYVVPRRQTFKVVGLQLSYRRTGGARNIDPWYNNNLQLADQMDILRMGTWGLLFAGGIFTGSLVVPRPFQPSVSVLFRDQPHVSYWQGVAGDINDTIDWHLRNYSTMCETVHRLVDRRYTKPKIHVEVLLNASMKGDKFLSELQRISGIPIPLYDRQNMYTVLQLLDMVQAYQIYSECGINKRVRSMLDTLQSFYRLRGELQQQTRTGMMQLFHHAVWDRISYNVYRRDYDRLPLAQQVDVRKRFDKLHWVYYIKNDPSAVLLRYMRSTLDSYTGKYAELQKLWKDLNEHFNIGTINPKATHPFYLRSPKKPGKAPGKVPGKAPGKARKRGGHVAPETTDDDIEEPYTDEPGDEPDLDNAEESDEDLVIVDPVEIPEVPDVIDPVLEEHVDEHVDGPTLCPHYVDQLQQLMGGIDPQTMSEYIVQRWAEVVPIAYHYYCRICGELLYIDDLEDFNIFGKQQIVTLGSDDRDPLWNRIFNEVQQALHFVQFHKGRNIKALQEYIADILLPQLQIERSKLQKSKTRSAVDVDYLLVITTFTYAIALLARMIMESPDRVTWIPEIQQQMRQRRSRKESFNTTLTICYQLVMRAKESLFGRIKDFSTSIVKTILIPAFTFANRIQTESIESEVEAVDIPHEQFVYLSNWVDYQYLYASLKLLRYPKLKPVDLDTIFGQHVTSVDKFLRSPHWYKHLWSPDITHPERLTYYEACYAEWVEYMQKELWNEWLLPLSPVLNNHWNRWQAVFEPFETKIRRNTILERLPAKYTFSEHGVAPVRRRIYDNEILCPDGQQHDYNLHRCTFVYRSGSVNKRFTLQQLRALPRVERARYKLVDQLCAHCKQSMHQKPRDVPGIAHAVHVSNFFRYYEMRCPQNGWAHEFELDSQGFVGDAACRDCGFRASYLSTTPESYYRKWKAQFESRTTQVVDLTPRLKIYRLPEMPKWRITHGSIMKMSQITTLPYSFWNNVGLTEGLDFDNILNGTFDPQSKASEAAAHGRVLRVSSHVDYIQRTYYSVRNNTRIEMPVSLRTALGNDLQIQGLGARMPDILVDYDRQIQYYSHTQSSFEAANYALHIMCSTLIWINDMKELKKLPHKLFVYMVEYIARAERMVSQLSVAKEKTTDNIVVNLDDEEVDSYLESGEQQDISERQLNDPFSLEDSDIVSANMGDDDDTIPAED